jgi:hypothetical protein
MKVHYILEFKNFSNVDLEKICLNLSLSRLLYLVRRKKKDFEWIFIYFTGHLV